MLGDRLEVRKSHLTYLDVRVTISSVNRAEVEKLKDWLLREFEFTEPESDWSDDGHD